MQYLGQFLPSKFARNAKIHTNAKPAVVLRCRLVLHVTPTLTNSLLPPVHLLKLLPSHQVGMLTVCTTKTPATIANFANMTTI